MHHIYLDNASTTGKKPKAVIDAVTNCLANYSVNPNRAAHSKSLEISHLIYKARENVSSFFNSSLEKTIFTSGTTEALNLAIQGTAKQGGHIITSVYEHNSVLRTLHALKIRNVIDYTIVKPENGTILTVSDVEKHIKDNTYMLALNHISNVNGAEINATDFGNLAYKHGLLFLLDAAQSAGHIPIDVRASKIDLLAFAGHKGLLGPQGIGGLCINDKVTLQHIKFGGTGTYSTELVQPSHYPEGFEAGTQNTPGILGLSAGVNFVKSNLKSIKDNISGLAKTVIDSLYKIKDVKVYTPPDSFCGVISFNVETLDPHTVADILDREYNISIRSGLHCAPLAHKFLNTFDTGGTVRISVGYLNTYNEINSFLEAIEQTVKKFN